VQEELARVQLKGTKVAVGTTDAVLSARLTARLAVAQSKAAATRLSLQRQMVDSGLVAARRWDDQGGT
jgi:hypothetical protein